MSSGMALAGNYHRYLFAKLGPFLHGRVWEIGSGYGQYTRLLLEHGHDVLASDIDDELLGRLQSSGLKAEFGSRLETVRIDLNSAAEIRGGSEWWNPDSILCLNVLEHIEDDVACIGAIGAVVRAETTAVFLCPAHQRLYGFMDSEAGHFRRYTRRTLAAAFARNGWSIVSSFYLNPIGALGWYVRNKLAPPASESIDDPRVNADIAFFDRYVLPISRMLDPLTAKLFGLSAVVVARKV